LEDYEVLVSSVANRKIVVILFASTAFVVSPRP
jgi:hypothetical protein